MKKLSSLRGEVEGWARLRQQASDTLELSQMDDESLRKDLEVETQEIEA